MAEPGAAIDAETMRCGLLLEGIERLRAHTQDLDAIVRDEIRRTLIEELRALTTEVAGAIAALRRVRRAGSLRLAIGAFSLSAAVSCVPAAAVWWLLPSQRQIAALRAERAALVRNLAELGARGARIQWSRCGTSRRLCVRIERHAPVYGGGADYAIVKGY